MSESKVKITIRTIDKAIPVFSIRIPYMFYSMDMRILSTLIELELCPEYARAK